jgi:hypothetical protein
LSLIAGMALAEPVESMLRFTKRARLANWPLLTLAVRWFEAAEALRAWENEHLLDECPAPEKLRAHRVLLSELVADGEILSWQARREDVNFHPVGFSVGDIEAELANLRDGYRMFHDPMPKPEAEAVLEAVFGPSPTGSDPGGAV